MTERAVNAEAGLALVDRMAGAYERARRRAVQSLDAQQRLGDNLDADNTLGLLGSIDACIGNLDAAETLLRATPGGPPGIATSSAIA